MLISYLEEKHPTKGVLLPAGISEMLIIGFAPCYTLNFQHRSSLDHFLTSNKFEIP